jgi:hypothetical protein
MSLSSFRSLLYKLARLLGDVSAVQHGRVAKRVERRVAGRFMGRIMGKIVR